MALGSTQPLTEMGTRNILGIFLGVKGGWCVSLTTLPPSMSRLSRKCGNLNISQHYGSSRPVTGIPLLTLLTSLRSRGPWIKISTRRHTILTELFCAIKHINIFLTTFIEYVFSAFPYFYLNINSYTNKKSSWL
jgi:hypothetical protein